jgi:uncharacterized integral membrane protein (TIGR00698 family)
MMAIIIGLLLRNLFSLPDAIKPGIAFSLKGVLKLGIILLGIRLSFGDILEVGLISLPVIMLCLSGALLFAYWLSAWMKLSPRLGALIAIGTSICGATAIAATGPAIDAEEEELTYAIANITLFGILAMFLYPFLANFLFADNSLMSGLLLGTAIHETSQVAGSGLIYTQLFEDETVLNVATVTKLVRNVFMVALIPLVAYLYRRESQAEDDAEINIRNLFPLFILGFLLVAFLRTVGDTLFADDATWEGVVDWVQTSAEILLAIAMAGVGLSTDFAQLRKLGVKPFYVGFATASCVISLSLSALLVLQALGV